jgi:hypothetical protein
VKQIGVRRSRRVPAPLSRRRKSETLNESKEICMATRFINKALSTAALGIAVVVFGLGVAGAPSVAKTSIVPLAEIKLVSETSVTSSEVAAAARFSRRGPRSLRGYFNTYAYSDASGKAGELVAIDIR